MKNIIVLGCGLVGKTIVKDLAKTHKVTAVDINTVKFDSENVTFVQQDLKSTSEIPALISNHDIAIIAVPGFMGYKTLEAAIDAGINIVDISFFPEDPFHLHQKAKQKNITVIVDCGIAPGLSNIILGYHSNVLQLTEFKCFVGGLPIKKNKPFEYKAPFSPIDVIEEYTRPARFVVNGEMVTKPAMSDVELIEFEKVGKLEAFNTDGLRSILKTIDCPNMIEKTLRYPGHIQKMQVFSDAGFFSNQKIKINNQEISPLEFTSELLTKNWKLDPQELEFTIMRIIVKGTKDGTSQTVTYDLYDEFDLKEQNSSMARTTGFTCNAIASLVLDGIISEKGLFAPEQISKNETIAQKTFAYLESRNISLEISNQAM